VKNTGLKNLIYVKNNSGNIISGAINYN